jgi:cytochrome c5
MRNLPLIFLLILALPVQASHSFGGLDMCALYPEIMPPGMPLDQLPQARSQGATVLQNYCTQCHMLPGPGRHTADEWPAVFKRMVMLMDVSNRFSGLLGNINVPDAAEQAQLLAYLQANSLKAMATKPAGLGAAAYENYCTGCHALPDPAQHTTSEWSDVLHRMQRNMQIMQFKAPSADNLMQIQLYLHSAQPVASSLPLIRQQRAAQTHYFESSLALGPFLLLVIIGLVRWIISQKRHRLSGTE